MSREPANRVMGDFGDKYTLPLEEFDGSPTDLTGATVRVHIRREGSMDIVTNKIVTVLAPATNGVVEWTVALTDFPSAGKYFVQVEANYGGTKILTWDLLEITVQEQYA